MMEFIELVFSVGIVVVMVLLLYWAVRYGD